MIDFQYRKNEIHQLVADDNLNRAIRRLMDFIRDFAEGTHLQAEAISVSADHTRFVREERKGILDRNDVSLIRNRIIHRILEVHTEACGYYKKPPSAPIDMPKPPIQRNTPENPVEIVQEEIITQHISQPPPPKNDIICRADLLVKEYKESDFRLGDISIEIGKNEILGVVGENGNGKTTLFRVLMGELKHDVGEMQFPVFGETDPTDLNWIKIQKHIAYVEQELPRWYGSLIDNLHYEASCNGIKGKANSKEIEYIIHRLGLTEHINKKWNQLSGGYKLRFSLAKAFVKKPQLLILDEPLANLDINAQALVLNDLRDLANSVKHPVSIVISSQHLDEIEFVADKILFVKNGEPIFYGLKSELGNDRHYNFFEIKTSLSKEKLAEKLGRLEITDIVYETMYAQIITPLSISYEELLREMLDQNIPFTYFRDISKSTKKLFV